MTVPEPIEHSVDRRPGKEDSSPGDIVHVPEPIEHSVDKRPSEEGSSLVDIGTVSEPIEHSGVRGAVDPPSVGQRMEHPDDSGNWQHGRQSHTDNYNTPVGIGTGGQESSQEAGEAIVARLGGSLVPDGVEVEFMIDTATSVFERMCASDPRMRSRLRLCRRRLVSADSSPLTVRGKLEMTVIFPGFSCEMLLVVASIGSGGLLGMEALQSYLPHQLDLQTGQLWADRRYSCISRD